MYMGRRERGSRGMGREIEMNEIVGMG